MRYFKCTIYSYNSKEFPPEYCSNIPAIFECNIPLRNIAATFRFQNSCWIGVDWIGLDWLLLEYCMLLRRIMPYTTLFNSSTPTKYAGSVGKHGYSFCFCSSMLLFYHQNGVKEYPINPFLTARKTLRNVVPSLSQMTQWVHNKSP